MRILPETDSARISFCQTHLPVWGLDPESIGLTGEEVHDLLRQTEEAALALAEARAARAASLAATQRLHDKAARMGTTAARLIRGIKTFAESQGVDDPSAAAAVYALAQIEPPNIGGREGRLKPPGKPTDIAIKLEPDGSVTLSWTAKTRGETGGGPVASGTGAMFIIRRKLPGEREYKMIGAAPGTTAPSRRAWFTDTTIPSSVGVGIEGVRYTIQSSRGGRTGATSRVVTVTFGSAELATGDAPRWLSGIFKGVSYGGIADVR